MLLICPVRPGDSNEELRYAMRSWDANLVIPGGLTLLTVGHCPPWLKPDVHIAGNRYDSMPIAVFDNIMLGSVEAMRLGMGDKTALYMNDDFFCLDPMDSVLPVRRNCTLAQQIDQFPGGAGTWWPRSLRLTASWLSSLGFPHPDSYEAHRPLPAVPSAMFKALSQWDEPLEGTVPQWRTVYGVLNHIEAYPIKDAKLGAKTSGVGTPWVSTSDQSWRIYSRDIKKRFQKPSQWEIA